MTLIRYILVDPDGTERDDLGEYECFEDSLEAADTLGCFLRIRHYDRRSPDLRSRARLRQSRATVP